MKTPFKKSLLTTSVIAGLYGASAAHATIVDELTFGEFSFQSDPPTILPTGTTGVSGAYGSAASGDTDFIRLIDLPIGIQTFSLVSSPEITTEKHFLQVFQNSGTTLLGFDIPLNSAVSTTFQTLADFDGTLDLLFTFENGNGFVNYTVELQPVPIPPAALLFASGLGALGAAKARRKAKRRA